MKYPKEFGPKSQTEALALLFTMLGNAYNCLAQYEADEEAAQEAKRKEHIKRVFSSDLFESEGRSDPAKSPGAHKEDEEQ